MCNTHRNLALDTVHHSGKKDLPPFRQRLFHPSPRKPLSTLYYYRFLNGHFVDVESPHMWPSVPGVFDFAQCSQGSPTL